MNPDKKSYIFGGILITASLIWLYFFKKNNSVHQSGAGGTGGGLPNSLLHDIIGSGSNNNGSVALVDQNNTVVAVVPVSNTSGGSGSTTNTTPQNSDAPNCSTPIITSAEINAQGQLIVAWSLPNPANYNAVTVQVSKNNGISYQNYALGSGQSPANLGTIYNPASPSYTPLNLIVRIKGNCSNNKETPVSDTTPVQDNYQPLV